LADGKRKRCLTLLFAALFGLSLPAAVAAETPLAGGAFTDVVSVGSTMSQSYAVTKDGSLWAWGDNRYGELGNGTEGIHAWSPRKALLNDVKEVSGGSYFAVALKRDGTVWTWGMNDAGRLGIGRSSEPVVSVPRSIALDGVVSVSAAGSGGFAIREDGTVWTWGDNFGGVLGFPERNILPKPVQIPGLRDIAKIASDAFYTLAVTEQGEVWGWGSAYPDGKQVIREPQKIESLTDIVDISVKSGRYTALRRDGTVWTEHIDRLDAPVQAKGIPRMKSLAAGISGVPGAIDIDGDVWIWNRIWHDPSSPAEKVEGVSGATQLTGSGGHWLALTEDHAVYAWGRNESGQLGIGQVVERASAPAIVVRPIAIFVDGKSAELPISPLLVSSRTFVPLRGVLERLGVEVVWNAEERTVNLSKNDTEVVLKPGSEEAIVNGKAVRLDAPSIFVNDRLFVPLRFVGETVGAAVAWDPERFRVDVASSP